MLFPQRGEIFMYNENCYFQSRLSEGYPKLRGSINPILAHFWGIFYITPNLLKYMGSHLASFLIYYCESFGQEIWVRCSFGRAKGAFNFWWFGHLKKLGKMEKLILTIFLHFSAWFIPQIDGAWKWDSLQCSIMKL